MKNIVTSFKINTLSFRKGLGVGLLFLLLTLGVGQMWGVYNYNWHGKVLYQVPTAWDLATNSTVQVGCARTTATNISTYQFYFGTMTNVTNTQLYYASISANHSSWNQNEYIYFTANTNSYGSGDFKINVNACYTTPLDYGVANDAGAYLFTPSSNANGTAVSGSYQSNSTSWNYTQTIKYAVSENGATAAELTSGTVPANIAMSSYKFASGTYNSVSTSTANKSLTAGGSNYSATISAARTATTTLTVSNITSGYTFLGWYSAASGGTELSTELTYTYYPTAATTVYARFSHETTHSVDITYKCGSTTVSTATSQAIGQVTASSITAPTVAGYTFSSWTLGNGISNQSGSTTVNPISVKTLSSGTYTMQANYTEDLSSPYTIKGGTNITGNNWSTAYNMTKKSGHSTESVVYYTFNISSTNSGVSGTADDWSFKVIKDGSTWYGLYASGSYWWERGTSANQPLKTGNQNIQICADVAGPYEIKVDYSTPASPKVTVTFPTKYSVTYSVSPSGAANAITTSPSVSSGGFVAAGTSVTFTHAAAKTGYSWYRWENGSGSSLGTGNTYTTTINANTTVVAKYRENTFNVTATASAGGSATPTSATSMGQITGGNITASPNTGYNFTNWTITSGTGYFGTSGTATTSTTASTKFRPTATATIRANFTAKTYTITLNKNGGSGSTAANVTATYNSSTLSASITNPTKTGYDFNGWHKDNGSGQLIINTSGVLQASTSYTGAGGIWTNDGGVTLYAGWTAKQTTVSFSQSGEGYASGGQSTTKTASYGSAMPTPISIPTAANGYAFMGYYDAAGGEGTQYYTSTGASARTWNKTASTATLYAYFKKAEITDITLNPGAVEWKESGDNYVKANPTIAPTPVGATVVCWELLYENEDPITGHDAVAETEGGTKPNQVKFNLAGLAAGNYIIRAKLHLSSCGGTLLSTYDKTVTVTNNFTLTVFYKCGDVTIKSSSEVDALPLTPKSITAPTITGYTFHHWVLGDGVTCASGTVGSESTPGTATISYTAIFDGSLTAVYTRKRMIYFYNTLSWTGVTVYFYKNNSYWNNTNGTGADQTYTFTNTPYSEGKHGNMTQIDGTNIYYFDCEAAGVNASYTNVVFTELDQHGYGYFAKTGSKKNKVIRRGDYNTNMPMFVPVSQTPVSMNGNKADYYNNGYWMNYPENTGYTLKIYTDPYANNATGAAREILFPYSADLKMPLKLDVEFNDTARHQYWYTIYRNDDVHMGANYTMNQNYHSDVALNSFNDKKIELITSAAGVYTFTLTYNNTESYYISVDYPVQENDYRIIYNDLATWSGAAHTSSWWHESRIIPKEANRTDTISFYIAKGSTPRIKVQRVSSITEGTGVVSWTDVGTWLNINSRVDSAGVYNLIVTQDGSGNLTTSSITKIEPYTGNYYIRTDCAGSTKWDSYTFSDHLMTYSDFSFSEANSFGEKYSHYYMHWCERNENIKFVVANDYSPCISDTLAQDYGNPYKNTDAGGTLKTDGAAAAVNDRYSSNVRFMYNYSTNKISRAYVASSTDKSRLFLVLRANARIDGDDHEALHDQDVTNGVILKDDQNWIYEEILYITPNTKFKLFASYALKTPERMDSVQYFRGAYYSGDNKTTCTFNASNSVVLISGSGGMQKARVIYDFKTNRLLAAWIPDGTAVDDPMAINADVLIEREHQEPAQYVTFTDDGALTGVKTIYGAMKFNRWILNNRSNSADDDPDHGKTAEQISTHHPPLAVGSQKSIYERALYFISFPFDVNLGEVFGFGTYGVHWIIEYYDGLTRAKNGYWLDSPPNWKYVMNPNGYTLKANQGYILCLDLDMMQADNFDFWSNGITTVELFFPSTTSNLGTLTEVTDVEIPALSSDYKCTINRPGEDGDRRIKDSYWRCIGVPSLNFYNTEVYKDEEHEQVIGWKTDYSWKGDESEFPFIYKWNMADNTITPQSTSNFSFQPMHSYLVQNGNAIHWTNVSAKPSSIVARRENDYQQIDYNWRLELAKDSQMVDQAYIRMSNLEQVTDTFDFGQDLSKEFNATRSNIYSFIGYEKAAANSMPLKTEQTTIVAIGLNIITAGEYTLGMPDGTDGVGVTLVDSETGTRTNLCALDYTVTLAAGDYNNRLFLEISPVKETPTGLEQLPTTNDQSPIKKLLIDGILYIVRDGKIFDARGARVE